MNHVKLQSHFVFNQSCFYRNHSRNYIQSYLQLYFDHQCIAEFASCKLIVSIYKMQLIFLVFEKSIKYRQLCCCFDDQYNISIT